MFPSLNTALQNQIDSINNTSTTEVETLGRSFVFDAEVKQFAVIDGRLVDTTSKEGIEQWICLCLGVYKDKYNIYKGTDFGCNIKDLVGHKLNSFYRSEIQREIKEALLKSEQIKNVSNITLSKENDKLNVTMEIELVNGDILNTSTTV